MLLNVMVAIERKRDRDHLIRLLEKLGTLTKAAKEPTDLWDSLRRDSFDLVFLGTGFLKEPLEESVQAIRQLPGRPDVLVVAPGVDPEERARLRAAGSVAVIETDVPPEPVKGQLEAVLERRHEENVQRIRLEQAGEQHNLRDFVTASPGMRRLISLARRVAASDTSLLIVGETGVGKEWLSRAIHEEGPRSKGPFIAVNLGAIPETLLESELFGHEEGAFTDAKRTHRGFFELAHGGTVFLDEIGEMPGRLQVKLLRVLQEKKVQRVGGEREIDVDVRIMAATNRDLEEEIQAERFRRDLYYRLGVVTLSVPPLRERREDIPDLVRSYLDVFEVRLGHQLDGIASGAMKSLVEYDWPGNVRELINVMERAVLLCPTDQIEVDDLPETITGPRGGGQGPVALGVPPTMNETDWLARPLKAVQKQAIETVERAYLEALLRQTAGQVGVTARRAGISVRSLYQKMREYGFQKEDFKLR